MIDMEQTYKRVGAAWNKVIAADEAGKKVPFKTDFVCSDRTWPHNVSAGLRIYQGVVIDAFEELPNWTDEELEAHLQSRLRTLMEGLKTRIDEYLKDA